MEKKTGTAATKAKNKYNAANYERLYPFVKKGKKERYQKAAEAACWLQMAAPGRREFFIFPECCITGDAMKHLQQPIPTARNMLTKRGCVHCRIMRQNVGSRQRQRRPDM